MRKVWLVRHGNRLDFIQPEWFTTAKFKYDPPLCAAGKSQAQETAIRLAQEDINHIFVSPYQRTLQTAMGVAIAQHLPLKIETGLGEWENPDWMPSAPQLTETRSVDITEQIDQNYQSLVVPQYPETRIRMLERAKRTMQRLLAHQRGNLLLIGHKEPLIGCGIAFLGKEPNFNFDVCGITEFCWVGDRWECTLANDQSHLSDPGVKIA